MVPQPERVVQYPSTALALLYIIFYMHHVPEAVRRDSECALFFALIFTHHFTPKGGMRVVCAQAANLPPFERAHEFRDHLFHSMVSNINFFCVFQGYERHAT